MPLPSHGGDRKSENEKSRLQCNFEKPKQGNQKSYLLRRLARDYPEALDRLETGELKSARAAAIEYGIVKVKTPLEQAIAFIRKIDGEDDLQKVRIR